MIGACAKVVIDSAAEMSTNEEAEMPANEEVDMSNDEEVEMANNEEAEMSNNEEVDMSNNEEVEMPNNGAAQMSNNEEVYRLWLKARLQKRMHLVSRAMAVCEAPYNKIFNETPAYKATFNPSLGTMGCYPGYATDRPHGPSF